jgi:DNA-binding NtrC family response regulator
MATFRDHPSLPVSTLRGPRKPVSEDSFAAPRQGDGRARFALDESSSEVHALRMPRPGQLCPDAGAYAAATVGTSPAMERLRSQVRRIAPYYRTALLTGPVGTGKEGVARMLHALSPCADGEFIACEASALAEAMLRDEGRAVLESLTASVAGGTLFLEDIGEVPPALQGALLRIWASTGRGRIRVVAGTHRDLRTMGVTGQFRPDLAQRLMGVEIAMTPLGERPEDLPAVIAETLKRVAGDRMVNVGDDALAMLLDHTWPGDIAEIDRVLFVALRKAEDAAILQPEHMPELRAEDPEADDDASSMQRLEDVVQHHVLGVLTRCGGNKLRAAEVLGISRSTLYRMLESCVGDSFSEM